MDNPVPARKRQKLSNGVVPSIPDTEQNAIDENGDIKTTEPTKAQKNSLFVRGLPTTTTSESLTDLFSNSFPVKHAVAVLDTTTKSCRGYGFVTFTDAEDAMRAKEEFKEHTIEGRRLRLDIAEPRYRDSSKAHDTDAVDVVKVRKQHVEANEVQPPKLIVRNLPWSIKHSDHLAKLFQSYGKVKQAYIPKKSGGLLAGFGFVVLRGHRNAEKAIEGVNGKEIDGRTLAVDWAVAKEVYEGTAKAEDQTQPDGALDGKDLDASEKAGSDDDDDTSVTEQEGSSEDSGNEASGPEMDEDDDEYADVESESESKNVEPQNRQEDNLSTIFVRNLPFNCTDEDLEDHFSQFGSTRYARIVIDPATERPRGTGFVCFYEKTDADACLREAPHRTLSTNLENRKDGKPAHNPQSVLQNEGADITGRFTIDGRVLQVSRAVNKTDADRLTQEGVASRNHRDKDKRRLYLLSEGTISPRSPLWDKITPSERTLREASAKQRKQLIESNPSLHLSLTRLSVRNIPRSVTSKQLKALARGAVVGFAKDIKAGKRQRLSKEELARGGDDMYEADRKRRLSGKGIVKQAKVVFETGSGSKVSEESGGGRSRGYGFIEYHTHRNALMGLRWLNGHGIDYQVKQGADSKASKEDLQDRKKRLVVEFAIENAQVVLRRYEKEQKAKDRVSNPTTKDPSDQPPSKIKDESRKRKRGSTAGNANSKKAESSETTNHRPNKQKIDDKIAKRNQIIGRKRAARRNRNKAS